MNIIWKSTEPLLKFMKRCDLEKLRNYDLLSELLGSNFLQILHPEIISILVVRAVVAGDGFRWLHIPGVFGLLRIASDGSR